MVVDRHSSQTLLVTISGHVLLPSSIAHPLLTSQAVSYRQAFLAVVIEAGG